MTNSQFPTTSPWDAGSMPKMPRVRSGRYLVIYLLGFGLLFFGGSYLVSPDPSVETQVVGVGFASVGGDEVALVPYERSGSKGMFEIMTQPMFQVRLAAVDLATGHRIWDVKLSDGLVWGAGVLAAGTQYAYLASADGLIIVKLSDGSIVARDSHIEGLGDSYIAAYGAYGFDAERQVVVAMSADGDIRSIPLDSLTAAPADAATTSLWAGRLTDGSSPPFPPTSTATEAVLSGTDTIALQPVTTGAIASTLVRVSAAGTTTPLGDTRFLDAEIVLDLTTPPNDWAAEEEGAAAEEASEIVDEANEALQDAMAEETVDAEALEELIEETQRLAGQTPLSPSVADPAAAAVAAGFVIVQHAENQNDDGLLLSVVSLETGQIVASTPMGSDVGRSLTSPSGLTVVIIPASDFMPRNLAIVGQSGTITLVEIGATNFFGFPI